MTLELSRRPGGIRYEIHTDNHTWWELGWDPALGTYYAQHWRTGDDIEIIDWHGDAPGELPDVAAVEAAVGLAIPGDIRAELEADRAAAALRQGLRG